MSPRRLVLFLEDTRASDARMALAKQGLVGPPAYRSIEKIRPMSPMSVSWGERLAARGETLVRPAGSPFSQTKFARCGIVWRWTMRTATVLARISYPGYLGARMRICWGCSMVCCWSSSAGCFVTLVRGRRSWAWPMRVWCCRSGRGRGCVRRSLRRRMRLAICRCLGSAAGGRGAPTRAGPMTRA